MLGFGCTISAATAGATSTATLLMLSTGTAGAALGSTDLLGNAVTPGSAQWTAQSSPLGGVSINANTFTDTSASLPAMTAFTLELMIYETSYASTLVISQTQGVRLFRAFSDSRFRLNADGIGTVFDTSSGVALANQWNYLMLEFNAGAYRLTCNGTQIGSASLATSFSAGAISFSPGSPPTYLSGMRLTRSVRYPSANPTQSDFVSGYLT